jgi:hypothetical protein
MSRTTPNNNNGKNSFLIHNQIAKKAKINYVENLLNNIFLGFKPLTSKILSYPTYPQGFILNP